MKVVFLNILTIGPVMDNKLAYTAGAVIAFLLLCYLFLYLIKPNKF